MGVAPGMACRRLPPDVAKGAKGLAAPALLVAALLSLLYLVARYLNTYQAWSVLWMAGWFVGVWAAFVAARAVRDLVGLGGWRGAGLRRRLRLWVYMAGMAGTRSTGEVVDLVVTCLSLASCAMYVLETYMPYLAIDTGWLVAEAAVSVVLLVDYLFRFFLAADGLRYVFSFVSVVNVLTIAPVLANTWYHLSTPGSSTCGGTATADSPAELTYFRLLRMLRVLRVLRALNLLRSAPTEDLRREVFTLVFTSVGIVFASAGLYQWLTNSDRCFSCSYRNTMSDESYDDYVEVDECVHFHWALYWCTISALNRPRLEMNNDLTVLMVIFLVAITCVVIPLQLSKIYTVMQQGSKSQRAEYIPSSSEARHVVFTGHLELAALNMLLYEFFHPDRFEQAVQDVVLLFPNSLDHGVEVLLSHPEYVGHVTYVQGSPLRESDLVRAGLHAATGVILLSNKEAADPSWHDSELVACAQSMKALWLKLESRRPREDLQSVLSRYSRPRIVVQVLMPETKQYLVELPGWTREDVVIVCSEYVSWMLGMATLARGMATVVFNLTSHSERREHPPGSWHQQYEEGAHQGLYSVKVRPGHVVGLDLMAAAQKLACHDVLLIAVESQDGGSHSGFHLFPGPLGFELREGDRLVCVARSNLRLHAAVEELLHARSRSSLRIASDLATKSSSQVGEQVEVLGDRRSWRSAGSFQSSDSSERSGTETAQGGRFGLWRKFRRSHTMPRGCEDVLPSSSFRACSQSLTMSQRSHSGVSCSSPAVVGAGEFGRFSLLSSAPSTQEPDFVEVDPGSVAEMLRQRWPPWTGHVVVCGLPSADLVETLRCAHGVCAGGAEVGGIFVVEYGAEEHMAALCARQPAVLRLVGQGRLRAASADPRNQDALVLLAAVGDARAVVALPGHHGAAAQEAGAQASAGGPPGAERRRRQTLDTSTSVTALMASAAASRARGERRRASQSAPPEGSPLSEAPHCVSLLLQESTSNLFSGVADLAGATAADPRWMDSSPLNMSSLFAAGNVFAMTCFDRFAVEAFFMPQAVPLIRMLVFGDLEDNRLQQAPCPGDFVGSTWRDVRRSMVADGRVPLGILRHGDGSRPSDAPAAPDISGEGSALPHVLTNPDASTVLRGSDLLFFVGPAAQAAPSPRADGSSSESAISV